MLDAATLATQAIAHASCEAGPRAESALIRKLFMMLHGAYGNLFVSKFSTGVVDDQGKDKGIRAAMLVWQSALLSYPGDVVELAAKRLIKENPEFPPNLGKFQVACDACMPRKTYAQENKLPPPRLAAPTTGGVTVVPERHNDGKDWARHIMARHASGEKILPYALLCAHQALGVPEQMPSSSLHSNEKPVEL